MRKTTHLIALALITAVVIPGMAKAQQDVTIAAPTHDRWHYPFNFTPGARTTGSNFTASPFTPFDYRDAMTMYRFDTTTDTGSAEYIPRGLEPHRYTFSGATMTVYHNAGTTATWDTRVASFDSAGQPFELQIFGMGVDDGFASFTLSTWTEGSPFSGSQGAPGAPDRNPHPLNIDDAATTQNATNLIGATPWGTGEPVYGVGPGQYTPGEIPAVPFPVTYTLDTDNPRVRAYIQESLSRGHLNWVLSAPVAAAQAGTNYHVPNFAMKESGFPARFELEGFELTPGAEIEHTSPNDDRWHYPFNFTPGTRTNGSVFTSPPGIGFDYRDAMIYLRFETDVEDSSGEIVPTGLAPEEYSFASVSVTMYHAAGTTATWDTRTPGFDAAGQPFELQIFGMGVSSSFTSYTLEQWTESSQFFGAAGAPNPPERNPHPLNIDDAATTQNVTNLVGATPWGTGEPEYGTGAGQYNPGDVVGMPFAVTFTLDTSNARVREYIQQSLAQGFLDFVISAPVAASQGGDNYHVPRFLFKESGGPAPVLRIESLRAADILVPVELSVFELN